MESRADAPLADCLARLGDGEDAAWTALVERGGPLLAAVCARVAGADAGEDALQEALLAARRRAGRFRAAGDDPERSARAWLTRLATTTSLQALRARRRARRRDDAVAASSPGLADGDAAQALERAETRALLRRELACLPSAQRDAVALHHLAGEPIAAVAQTQGIAIEAAKKRVQRGVDRLRERLARAGLALTPAALVALLGDTADAAPPPIAAAAARAVARGATATATVSGAFAMATAACTPAITLLALIAWRGAAADAPTPMPVGDQRPAAESGRPGDAALTAAARAADGALVLPTLDREPSPAKRAQLEQQVTLDFEDSELTEATTFVEKITGVTIAIAPDVFAYGARKITLKVDSLRVADVVSLIARTEDARWRWRGDVIWIDRGQAPMPARPAVVVDAQDRALADRLAKRVTFEFVDTTLVDVVDFFRQISGANIVVHPELRDAPPAPITLRANDLTLSDAIQTVAALCGVGCAVIDHVVYLAPKPDGQGVDGAPEAVAHPAPQPAAPAVADPPAIVQPPAVVVAPPGIPAAEPAPAPLPPPGAAKPPMAH